MDPDRYAGFMRAVLADPESDAPRLVLADALEEAGDGDRSEFIRVGCELAALPECLGCNGYGKVSPKALPGNWDADGPVPCPWCSRYALRRREAELFVPAALDWLPLGRSPGWGWDVPNAAVVAHGGIHWQFRRGFVEHVKMTAACWMEHGPAVVRAQPVRKVLLATLEDSDLEALAEAVEAKAALAHDRPSRHPWYAQELLEFLWPKIEFVLPERGNRLWNPDAAGLFR